LYVHISESFAELGSWMTFISSCEFEEISHYIFSNYTNVDYVSFFNTISDKVFIPRNHYHIVLPSSYNDLIKRLSSKSRNTMNRKRKKVELEYGNIYMIEYENEEIPDDVICAYFKMKEETHHIDYNMSSAEYIKKYHVSNVYILHFGEKVAAMILTCEQCPIVYLENLTYDMEFSKYSPGFMAYDMVLERLIEKGKSSIYLGGGDYGYKKMYNSIETIVTDGKIYRSFPIKIKYKLIDYYNKHILWKLRTLKNKGSFH